MGKGNGSFGKPHFYSVNGVGPDGIASEDVNNDGKADVVVANNDFQAQSTVSVLVGNGDGTLALLLGNGDGTFRPVIFRNLGAGAAPVDVTSGVFAKHVGTPDLAIALLYANEAAVILNSH